MSDLVLLPAHYAGSHEQLSSLNECDDFDFITIVTRRGNSVIANLGGRFRIQDSRKRYRSRGVVVSEIAAPPLVECGTVAEAIVAALG
jgi:hypothetical protein